MLCEKLITAKKRCILLKSGESMWMFHYMVIRSCLNIRRGEGRCRDEKLRMIWDGGRTGRKGFKKNADVCRKIIFLNGCLSEEKSAGITEGISFLEKKSRQKTGSIDPAFCRGEEKELYESIQGGKTLYALMESR